MILLSQIGQSNSFTKLLFNYLIAIRNKIWARKFESQGMYGVSNAIVNLLKKMFENSVWRHLHEQELKDSIKNIMNLNFQEKDAILSLFGGELQGLTTGVVVQDKNENKIALLGFADQWIEDQDDQAKKNLKVPRTTMNFETKTNKAIGLFINETSQDNNEVLILDPQELVLLECSSRRNNQLPIKDLLMDKEIMLKLIQEGIINLSKENSEKMSIEELNFKILITKIIFNLINEREEQFIDFLKQPQMQNIFQEFLNLLFQESCKVLKTPITLQLDWVEQKCFEIRRAACESKITLVKLKELSAQVIIDKVFFSYNSQKLQKEYLDYDLVGAINFENIVDMQTKVGFFSADDRVKTPEFMVISSTDLYTELGIKRLAEAEVVLSSGELNLEEYLVFLERQERKAKGITEKPIQITLLIDKEDFEDVHQKFLIEQIHMKTIEEEEPLDDSLKTEAEFIQQAQIISEFVGLDYEKVLKMVRQVDSDFSLTSKLNGLIKEEQKKIEEERKKKQEEEEAKRLRRDQDEEEEKQSLNQEEEKKEENAFIADDNTVQIDTSTGVQALDITQSKKQNYTKVSEEEQIKRQKAKEQKDRDEMISYVMDLVEEDIGVAYKFELKERKKLEQQTAEALFKSVRGFTEANAYNEYQQSLDLLFTLYSYQSNKIQFLCNITQQTPEECFRRFLPLNSKNLCL